MNFSNDWFTRTEAMWNFLFDELQPVNYLEVGSYEGQATCYAIEHIGQRGGRVEVIDPYSAEYAERTGGEMPDMDIVWDRFNANVLEALDSTDEKVEFYHYHMDSTRALTELVASGRTYDFIFIDGGHSAKQVLIDGVMAFELLSVGGALVFDDYGWALCPGTNPLGTPKLAIDAISTIYHAELIDVRYAPLYQRYFTKVESRDGGIAVQNS